MRLLLLKYLSLAGLVSALIYAALHSVGPKLLEGQFTKRGTAVEVESAAQFSAKLEYVRALEGLRVALIGDSFILGESLNPALGPDWRGETLDKRLSTCLSAPNPSSPVHVINFGLNGLLPEDMRRLRPALDEVTDLVVININSRSFASDFKGEEGRNSRSWIAAPLSNEASLMDVNSSRLALLKRYGFSESPQDWGQRVAQSFFGIFGPVETKSTRISEGILMLKLKSRYASASYDPKVSEQAAALADILSKPNVVAFRTIEDASRFRRAADGPTRARLDAELKALIETGNAGEKILPSPSDLTPDDYLDLVHVTPSGYEKYSRAMCKSLAARLSP